MAPQAMLWLQERAFDVVHFADWQGHGYYTLLAKHSGVGFTGTTLCLMVPPPAPATLPSTSF